MVTNFQPHYSHLGDEELLLIAGEDRWRLIVELRSTKRAWSPFPHSEEHTYLICDGVVEEGYLASLGMTSRVWWWFPGANPGKRSYPSEIVPLCVGWIAV